MWCFVIKAVVYYWMHTCIASKTTLLRRNGVAISLPSRGMSECRGKGKVQNNGDQKSAVLALFHRIKVLVRLLGLSLSERLFGNIKLSYIHTSKLIAVCTRVMWFSVDIFVFGQQSWLFTPIANAFDCEHVFSPPGSGAQFAADYRISAEGKLSICYVVWDGNRLRYKGWELLMTGVISRN